MKYLNGVFREIIITVDTETIYEQMEGSLEDYIEKLQKNMDRVPEEYRGGTYITITGSSSFESEECTIEAAIRYPRPETHDERYRRLLNDAQRTILFDDRLRDREINQLRDLMSRYGKV